jgi:Cof subfamily protein (haloacid dehalogenase superfamily)
MDGVRVIVSDLDGTLANDERVIFSSTLERLERFLDQGYSFAVATARPLGYLEGVFPKRVFDRIWKICHNGAQLFSPDGRVIFKHSIDHGDQMALLRALGDAYTSISWYSGDTWYTDEAFTDALRPFYGIPQHYPAPVMSDTAVLSARGAEKLLVVGAHRPDALVEAFKDRLCIHKSRSEDLLMVSAGVASKASASEAMLAYLGYSWEQAAAIGDDMNDASLLSMAAVSFATAESPEDLKRIATYKVGSNNDPAMFPGVFDAITDAEPLPALPS